LLETLRPLRARLVPPLSLIYQDQTMAESVRSLATSILADYAADDPRALADLLMSAETNQYAILFPVAQKIAAGVLPLLQAEIEKREAPRWNDAPLDPGWAQPDPAWNRRFESAHGFLDEHLDSARRCHWQTPQAWPRVSGSAVTTRFDSAPTPTAL
jgi:hypothetical protein